MKHALDLETAARLATARFSEPRTSARMESLQALQDAYEDWRLVHGGVGVTDFFWSWTLDNA